MTSFPGSPRVVKGGIALIDPNSGAVQRIIALQYNPDTLTRSLQVQSMGDNADRSEALRLKGPAIETIKLDAEIDATDQLELGEAPATDLGIHPQLAALETIVYPTSSQLLEQQYAGAQRHAGDRTHAGAAGAVYLEQEPHSARAHHRVQHHRRGL